MLYSYPACFYQEKEGNYSVIFPDLNHLATQGDDLNDALAMAIDCLAGFIFFAQKDKAVLPPPSTLQAVKPDDEYDEYENVFVNYVSVDVEEYAKLHFEIPVKKTLTIPKWINDAATSQQINFSKVLQKALLQELHLL